MRYRQGLANHLKCSRQASSSTPPKTRSRRFGRTVRPPTRSLYRALGGGWGLTNAQWQGEAATK